MEWVIQISAIVLSLLLAIVKSLRYTPNGLSDFELHRQVHAGNAHAIAEQQRRELLPTFIALQSGKEMIISIAIAVLLISTHSSAVGTLLSAMYFFLAYIIAARGWLAGFAGYLQHHGETRHMQIVAKLAPFMRWLTPKKGEGGGGSIASQDELRMVIANDTQLLAPDDKARLLGAFDFGSMLVGDAMVARDDIVTIDADETVGPLLLDKLHKNQHNMFVVIKKDLDHIKGWLYMADLMPLDPDIKKVKDATRPTVHYIPVNAPLSDILAASLTTGRQMFIVVDDAGETKGLISLKDALTRLVGEPLVKETTVSTKPTAT